MGNQTKTILIEDKLVKDILDELHRAQKHGDTFSSLHEAYGVLLEEIDEVWDITRQKKKLRSKKELREEFIQVAAMAIKALQSLDNFVGGDV